MNVVYKSADCSTLLQTTHLNFILGFLGLRRHLLIKYLVTYPSVLQLGLQQRTAAAEILSQSIILYHSSFISRVLPCSIIRGQSEICERDSLALRRRHAASTFI